MSEVYRELPPVGSFNIGAIHAAPSYRGVTTVHCNSEISPIQLDISFPDPAKPTEALDDLHRSGEASYLLRWPSEMTKDEVVELIRQVGEGQVDSEYLGIIFPEGMSSKTLDDIIAGKTVDLSLVDDDELAKATKAPSVDEVVESGFDELSVESSDISLVWEANDDVEYTPPDFSFMTANNYELTEMYVQNLIKRTIVARHVGGVAASLENLSAIFEMYRYQDPINLIG
ncbi:MAG: hypothetical protein WD885_02650 [Candidatus Saccharimonadales bacterium]